MITDQELIDAALAEYPIDMLETSKGCFDDMNLGYREDFLRGARKAAYMYENDSEKFILKLMESDPKKVATWMLLIMGKECVKCNATELEQQVEANIGDTRYSIQTITLIKQIKEQFDANKKSIGMTEERVKDMKSFYIKTLIFQIIMYSLLSFCVYTDIGFRYFVIIVGVISILLFNIIPYIKLIKRK